MQLFPPAGELQFLLGKEIASICFEPSGVHFLWWAGGEIHAMRDFDHIDREGQRHHFGMGMWSDPASSLHHLIQRKVAALDVADESLMLNFDDGQKLVFFARAGGGENGLIHLGKSLEDDYIIW